MTHRSLYVGFGIASLISVLLAALALRPLPPFPREEPLVKTLPSNIDEWPEK